MESIVKILNNEEMNYPEEERPLYHKNCAEILLMAANEKYELGLDNRFFKSVCPFGGGIQLGKTCGALLGATSALGIMFADDRPCNNDKMKQLTKQFVEEFEKEFGSIDCDYIKEHHRSETEGCSPVKVRAAKVFDKIVKTAKHNQTIEEN